MPQGRDPAAPLISEFVRRPGSGRPPPATPDVLTGRECEVLTLVARGWPGAEIAERLYLSPATAETHVGRLRTSSRRATGPGSSSSPARPGWSPRAGHRPRRSRPFPRDGRTICLPGNPHHRDQPAPPRRDHEITVALRRIAGDRVVPALWSSLVRRKSQMTFPVHARRSAHRRQRKGHGLPVCCPDPPGRLAIPDR